MLQAGEVLQGRYEIRNVVGQGGMSTVYRAREVNTRKVLAIKDVKRAATEKNQVVVEQSLAAEGRMLMQLSHPRLPKIYEVIENNDSIMLVMDFITGESLDHVLKRTGAQSVEQTLEWGMQICEVFHYLHNQPTPIIYRDMKPANVMLQPNGQLMMIDFGTARTQKVGVNMQADTICIGTAGFAAPEQFGGIGQSTARTDIFCLGATLYNIVTGHSPCDRPTGIMPLEMWNPALANSPISEIITKCTRNDPNERYQTAMELYEDLRLASIGAYQVKGKRKGGLFTSNLGKGGFQRQDLHGSTGMITGGLSDILHLGKSGQSAPLTPEPAAPPTQRTSQPQQVNAPGGWQTAAPQIPVENQQYPQQEDSMLSKLVIIGLAVAVIFVVLTVVLALLKQTSAAVVFLVIAVAAAIGALVCMMISQRR